MNEEMPYELQLHTTDDHAACISKYYEKKESVDAAFANMNAAFNFSDGYLSDLTSVNTMKATAINQQTLNDLRQLQASYAYDQTPLYGPSSINPHSAAQFVDRHTVITNQDKALTMISNGMATPSILQQFQMSYPQVWASYRNGLVDAISKDDLTPEGRLVNYSIANIETMPSFSKRGSIEQLQQKAMMQQQKPEAPRQMSKKISGNNQAPASNNKLENLKAAL